MNSFKFIFILSFFLLFIGKINLYAQDANSEVQTLQAAGIRSLSISPNKNTEINHKHIRSFTHLYSQAYGWNSSSNSSITSVSSALFPKYVRENPRGYSYLCRLELKVEEKLPIGLWVKFGENNGLKDIVSSPANVRMKLLSF